MKDANKIETVTEIRKSCCDFIESEYNRKAPWVIRSFDAYEMLATERDIRKRIRKMRKNGEWGTLIELMAFAILHECEVKIAKPGYNDDNKWWVASVELAIIGDNLWQFSL
jgi:hypothetical protein